MSGSAWPHPEGTRKQRILTSGGTSNSGRLAQPFCVMVSAFDRERLQGVPGTVRMRLNIGIERQGAEYPVHAPRGRKQPMLPYSADREECVMEVAESSAPIPQPMKETDSDPIVAVQLKIQASPYSDVDGKDILYRGNAK
jgi:hypothetical protein